MNDERIELRESGNWLHVFQFEDMWQVFLNSTDVDEIYVGGGATRDEAIAAAVATFEEAVEQLNGRPSPEAAAKAWEMFDKLTTEDTEENYGSKEN
jgi:hypothetical protein